MHHACRFGDTVAVDAGEPGVAIGLEDAAEVAQVLARMFALAVGCVTIERAWWRCAPERVASALAPDCLVT